ncbi:MAG: hypothetical protein LBH03_07260, partial [Holophagales bacterium]|nr:hypothetical protein [Holophagales bacterium]
GALPYDLNNARLLHRAIFWAANKEGRLTEWFCENPQTDCAYYPNTNQLVVVNNSPLQQNTFVHMDNGNKAEFCLRPFESRWAKI